MPGCESRSLSDSRSKMRARPRRTLHPPSGGAAAPRLFDRITVAGAPKRDQGVRPTRRKPVNCHDRGGAPAVVPGTHAAEGQIRRLDTRPDHRRYAHTARHRQSSGGLHQHRQDPLIMPVWGIHLTGVPSSEACLGRSDLGELNPRPAPMTFSYRSCSAYMNSPDARCSCYRRVGRLPDPDLCCSCVGRSSPASRRACTPNPAPSHRHARPPATRRAAAAGYPLARRPARYPAARPGMTHRDGQSMRRWTKSTHIPADYSLDRAEPV